MFYMFKKIVKNLVFSFLFIYAFNVIMYPLNMIMSFNLINVFFVTFLGFPYIIVFSLFSLLYF